MIRSLALACLCVLAVAGGAAAEGTLCKDQCIKSCMGNDTPTERANCLAREKCDNRQACPAGAFGTTGTFFFDSGSPPPKPKWQLPTVHRSGVLAQ